MKKNCHTEARKFFPVSPYFLVDTARPRQGFEPPCQGFKRVFVASFADIRLAGNIVKPYADPDWEKGVWKKVQTLSIRIANHEWTAIFCMRTKQLNYKCMSMKKIITLLILPATFFRT
jgi:hypothetical protein